MGTRNLTAVMFNGEYKVAQYGQWDGYPSGQGLDILDFLKSNAGIEKLKSNLSKVSFLDMDGDFIKGYDESCPTYSDPIDRRTKEQLDWARKYQSRDLGGKILNSIADSDDNEILLINNIEFKDDTVSCEFAYCVDLDGGTFEVYDSYGQANNQRFDKLRLLKAYDLKYLPSEEDFLTLENEED